MRSKLSQDEIDAKLKGLPEWHSTGQNLSRDFKFKSFKSALSFVNKVGEIAEKENHHPDIMLGWGYAKITFTTHDAGGLTQSDFKLAKLVDEISL